jgi:hypothetical protein
MIALLIEMLRTRRAQAVTVFLLSAVATAAAVAGPIALRTVDQAVLRHEVAGASNIERTVSVNAFINPSDDGAAGQFDTIADLLRLPGFESIRAGEFEVFGPVPDPQEAFGTPTSRLVFRDRICEHLTMLRGRCLSGPLEIVVGEDTARKAGLDPGEVAVVQAARYVEGRGLIADGAEARLTVTGVYRATDPTEVYWAGQRYFPVTADGTRREAVFTSVLTFDLVEHTLGQTVLDTLAPAEALTLERVDGLPEELEQVLGPVTGDQSYAVETDIPELAERVEASREIAGRLVPVAFIPLVGISFFVIFLAVGYGISGRRPELAVVTLRGTRPLRRWWLATGETLTAIVLGAPVGYLLGHVAVALVASWRLGAADGAEISLRTVPYALLALLGSVGVALLGQRRSLSEPVVELLRGVPRAAARWQSLVVEIVVIALAVVATIQLRGTSAGLTGVALLVPGLIVVTVALVAARAFAPVAGALTRTALRRGRLGLGLAAVQIARRPGSQRLFVLLTVASAMLAFVAAGIDVANRARDDRARIMTGATRVLTVDQGDPRRLLHITRSVDPQGAWSMVAMPVEQTDALAPVMLAVDSSRLGAVAAWRPEFGLSAREVADALRPQAAEPFTFHGTQLTIDLERFALGDDQPVALNLGLIPLTGGDRVVATVPDVTLGREVRTVNVAGCRDGCRFQSLSLPIPLRSFERSSGVVGVLIRSVRQVDPPADVIPPSELVKRARWRNTQSAQVSMNGEGLQVVTDPSPFFTGDAVVSAVDAPLPVPIVLAGSGQVTHLSGLDNQVVQIQVAGRPAMLPRLGAHGALVDIDYLERTSLSTPRRGPAEIWLGPAAPADAAERLRKAGIAVAGETGVQQARAALDRQGPALALQFHLAAAAIGIGLALGGLGLVAAVDRRQRSEDLRSLRRQGLSRSLVGRAAYGGYLVIALVAMLVGLGAAAAAWWAAGDRLPVFTDSVAALAPPGWPVLEAVVTTWAFAAAGMLGAALLAGLLLHRAANVGNGKG